MRTCPFCFGTGQKLEEIYTFDGVFPISNFELASCSNCGGTGSGYGD